MANIIIGSEFKPFSYEEMLAPVMLALQAHLLLEDAYSELETKASIWDNMASEENDPIAHNTYKLYARDLLIQADNLALNGLTPGSRKKMLGLKSRYAKDIMPIELAYARRKELQDELRKALLLNPTLMFLRDLNHIGYLSSLDRFIENPLYDYGLNYSGALLTLQVATKAAALAKELRDPSENGLKLRKQLELILPYQYRLLELSGFSSSEVLNAIALDPNASSILTNLVNNTLDSSGIANWADKATMEKARAYANEGLWNAVGQSSYKYLTDLAGLTTLQYDLMDRNAKRAEERKKQDEKDLINLGIALSYDTFLNSSEDLSKYKGLMSTLFTLDGKLNAAYFGKSLTNGQTLDPIEIYKLYHEAYNAAYRSAGRKYDSKISEAQSKAAYEAGYGYYKLKVDLLKTEKSLALSRAAASAALGILLKYGVTKVLSEDLYNTLTAMGVDTRYDKSKHGSMIDFYNTYATNINNRAIEQSFYSTNMSDYSHIDEKIRRYLNNADSNGYFKGLVYTLNSDGTLGKAASYKDLGIKSDSNSSGKEIKDISYSAVHPDKIIILIGEDGAKYLVDPSVLGGEFSNIILTAQRALAEGASKSTVSYNTTVGIAGLLNSYNPVRGKTSSDFNK